MKKILLVLIALLFANVCSAEIDKQAVTKDYMGYIQKTVNNNMQYEDDKSVSAVVQFILRADGKIADLKISQSGSQEFDKALKTAVYKSVPFKEIPKELNYSEVNVSLKFDYNAQTPDMNLHIVRNVGDKGNSKLTLSENTVESNKVCEEYSDKIGQLLMKNIPASYYTKRDVKIKITLGKFGKLENCEVEPTGSERYDKRVKNAIELTKFPPPPKEANCQKLDLTFKMTKTRAPYVFIIPLRF